MLENDYHISRAIFKAILICFVIVLLSCEEEVRVPVISDIRFEGISFSGSFDPTVRFYEAFVPYEKESAQIFVTKSDPNVSMRIYLNDQLIIGTQLSIPIGLSVLRIVGVYEYVFNLTRSRSPFLAALEVNSMNPEFEEVLKPMFSPRVESINYAFERKVEKVNIEFLKEDSLATVSISSNNQFFVGNELLLSVGSNAFQIEVTSSDSLSVKVYELIIDRIPLGDASMKGISHSTGVLEPEFDPGIHEYTLFVPSRGNFSIEPEIDEFATKIITYDGFPILNGENLEIPDNPTEMIIGITADDKLATSAYSITIQNTRWKFVGHGPFSPRDGAAVIEFKDKLWLLGGWENGPLSSEVWSSTNAEEWQLETVAPWQGRHGAGVVVLNDKMWIVSGDGMPDVWSTSDGINWDLELDDAPWGRRYAPTVVSFEGKIWLMGGANYYGENLINQIPSGPLNDVWSSSDGINWQSVSIEAPWAPRGLVHGSIVFNGRLWIIGGGYKFGSNPVIGYGYRDVWSTADGINWQLELDEAPWQGGYHFSTAVFDDKIWLTDGSIGEQVNLSNRVWYSPDGINWMRQKGVPWQPTHASSLIAFRGDLYIIAGYIKNDIWKFGLE